jgi:DNA-binding transcriptional LysR family regulator
MDRFTVMKSFVTVARCESFAMAARTLSISRALVSRHIADLEKQVGIRLLNRTTRSVTLTESGMQYLEFCKRILAEIAERDAQMLGMKENAEGDLSVVSPKWIGSLDLGDAIAQFAQDHPLIRVRLELGGLSERTYNFVEEGYDIAFNTKNLRDSSIMVRKIAPLHFALCASPEYLARRGTPTTPADLAKHDCLLHVNDPIWHFVDGRTKHNYKPHKVAFSSNTYLVLQKAAIRNMGVALLPVRSVYPEIKSGQLEVVLQGFNVPERPLYAIYAPGRQLVRKVRVFVDFIAEWFKQHPALSTKGR